MCGGTDKTCCRISNIILLETKVSMGLSSRTLHHSSICQHLAREENTLQKLQKWTDIIVAWTVGAQSGIQRAVTIF